MTVEGDAPNELSRLLEDAAVLRARGALEDAERVYRQALSTTQNDDPRRARVVLELVGVLRARGDLAGLERELSAAAEVLPQPGRAQVLIELARLQLELGDAAKAKRIFRVALDGIPDDTRATVVLEFTRLLQTLGQSSEAGATLRRFIEVVPETERSSLLVELARLEAEGKAPDQVPADDATAAGRADPKEVRFDLLASAAGDLPSSEDLLGFAPLVRALHALLDDSKTVLPLAMAVTGPWGAGKSSVMRQLEALLDGAPTRWHGGRVASHRKWRTVRFDAWKYEHSERLWAALVRAIYDQSQASMSLRAKLVFRLRLERRRLGWWKLMGVTLAPCLAAVAAATAALSADLSKQGTTLAGLSTAALILGVGSRYGAMIVNPFRRAIEKYAKRPDFEAQLGFTAQADSEIRKLVSLLAPRSEDGLAVFVDDLDRCSSAHVVEVVEAMNQIFNAAEDHRCVFILGLDRDIIATNIKVAYKDTVGQLKSDGNPLGEQFGSEFLAKLVQLSVAVPQPEPNAIRRLMQAIVGSAPTEPPISELEVQRAQAAIREKAADETLESIENAAAEVAAESISSPVVQVAKRRERAERIKDSPAVIAAEFAALAFLDPNPRQVKRFHNAFRLQLYVASEDDRVTFDFSPDQLMALARWVALRLRWPNLADALARDPELLIFLEATANDEAGSPAGTAVDHLREQQALWLANAAAIALVREDNEARRLSALRLDSFVRVA